MREQVIGKGTPIWNDLQVGRVDLVCGHITAKGTGGAKCQSFMERRLAEQVKCNEGSQTALGCSFVNAEDGGIGIWRIELAPKLLV